jgi:hypothetical protein
MAGCGGKSALKAIGLSVTRRLCSPDDRMSSCDGWPADVIGCAAAAVAIESVAAAMIERVADRRSMVAEV